MPYDERFAERVRALAASIEPETEARAMFGGLAILIGGKMLVGVIGTDLMVRVGKDRYAEALAHPHVREMDFTGRALAGYVYVAPAGTARITELHRWTEWGLGVARAARPTPARRKRAAGPPARSRK